MFHASTAPSLDVEFGPAAWHSHATNQPHRPLLLTLNFSDPQNGQGSSLIPPTYSTPASFLARRSKSSACLSRASSMSS